MPAAPTVRPPRNGPIARHRSAPKSAGSTGATAELAVCSPTTASAAAKTFFMPAIVVSGFRRTLYRATWTLRGRSLAAYPHLTRLLPVLTSAVFATYEAVLCATDTQHPAGCGSAEAHDGTLGGAGRGGARDLAWGPWGQEHAPRPDVYVRPHEDEGRQPGHDGQGSGRPRVERQAGAG